MRKRKQFQHVASFFDDDDNDEDDKGNGLTLYKKERMEENLNDGVEESAMKKRVARVFGTGEPESRANSTKSGERNEARLKSPLPPSSTSFPSSSSATSYLDARDAQFDACNRLRRDLALLRTREEKRNLIRERLPECYLVFVYALHPQLDLGPMHSASPLDDCDEYDVESTTAPQSIFQLLDFLQNAKDVENQDEKDEQNECENKEEEEFFLVDGKRVNTCSGKSSTSEQDAARAICAWLREHSDHSDWIRVILDRDKHGFHSLFGPLVSLYSLESNLRWFFSTENKTTQHHC